jgi:formamidopyrimidine-DNA glycosylase
VPELPEVEAARVLARRVAVGRRIVEAIPAADSIVFEGVSPLRVRRVLTGRRVVNVRRRGKHLWLELDRRPWPTFHFGMAGGFYSTGGRGVRLVSHGSVDRLADWPPRFTKLRLVFDDGGELAMADGRRLGRIRLREDPPSEPPISLLGWDALLEVPTPERFCAALRERKAPIKAVLLDQGFSAGVGNWIADEVLYQAKIAPARRADTLSEAEARRLRIKIRAVMQRAVGARSDSDYFPRGWLFHYRWGRNADARTARGERIRHTTVGGRTTAWVPAVQK